jgi:hypothetical protein
VSKSTIELVIGQESLGLGHDEGMTLMERIKAAGDQGDKVFLLVSMQVD